MTEFFPDPPFDEKGMDEYLLSQKKLLKVGVFVHDLRFSPRTRSTTALRMIIPMSMLTEFREAAYALDTGSKTKKGRKCRHSPVRIFHAIHEIYPS